MIPTCTACLSTKIHSPPKRYHWISARCQCWRLQFSIQLMSHGGKSRTGMFDKVDRSIHLSKYMQKARLVLPHRSPFHNNPPWPFLNQENTISWMPPTITSFLLQITIIKRIWRCRSKNLTEPFLTQSGERYDLIHVSPHFEPLW